MKMLVVITAALLWAFAATAQTINCQITLTPYGDAVCECDAGEVIPEPEPEPDPACIHDECTVGGPLGETCSDCAPIVCGCDPYCCAGKWDVFCVHEAEKLCGLACNSGYYCLDGCGC